MAATQLGAAVAHLPAYLGSHVVVSATALLIGLCISLPLSLISLRRPRLRAALLGTANVVQTVPGLALLALFYPLLLAITVPLAGIGIHISALGFLPAVLALALYSILPVMRNTITGILGLDPAITRAARGVGMTPWQSLRFVELPLALPVIMAGIRTASVWVIGTAALSTPIGQESLGNYIFTGLQTQNSVFVIFGCVCAAALALAVDFALAQIQSGLARRQRPRIATGAATIAAILLLAIAARPMTSGPAAIVIGAKPFGEQYVLASLIEQRLSRQGLGTRRKDGLGSAVIFQALAGNEIDVYVEYTGTIWANQMKRSDVQPPETVLSEVTQWLRTRHAVEVVGKLGFENAYALAISERRAAELGIRTLDDLARIAGRLSIAGDPEFFARPEWAAVRDAYGLRFREQRQMQAEFMYQAAATGDIDVIAAYTSDGRIDQFALRVLDDPRRALPPYDAIILVSPRAKPDAALRSALGRLVGAIPVEAMRKANRALGAGDTADSVAHRLSDQIAR